MKYTVIRDTREQAGWEFSPTNNCDGTVVEKLTTGDYTIKGFEKILTIERKGTTGEFARNIYDKRFERELVRMQTYKHGFIILEFDMSDIINFPNGSGIPKSQWGKLKISPWYMLKRLVEFDLKYNAKIILAGKFGREAAASIFKRIMEEYGEQEILKS